MLSTRRKSNTRQMKNLGEPSMSSEHIPAELLYNIFLMLNREEIEKCQLVTSRWKDLIDTNSPILPLYLFHEMCITREIFMIRERGGQAMKLSHGDRLDLQIIRSLKNVVFERYIWSEWTRSSVAEEMTKKLAKESGGSIKTIEFYGNGLYDEYQQVLENYVQASKVHLKLMRTELKQLFTKNNFAQLSTPPSRICIDCRDPLNAKVLLDFMKSGNDASRFTLILGTPRTDLVHFYGNLVQLFKESGNPEKFSRHIQLVGRDHGLFYSTSRTIFDNGIVTCTRKDEENRVVYQIDRKDGWVLIVAFQKDITESEDEDLIMNYKIELIVFKK